MKRLSFANDILPRPAYNKILDAYTTLNHYCQINFATPTAKLKKFMHPRFEPTTININGSEPMSIISAVVFQEKNFHFVKMPFLGKYTFSQTNYRTYCIDKETNTRTVWFFGTTLDHWSLFIPKHVWRFPWHKAEINFDFEKPKENDTKFYNSYRMTARSDWGPADVTVLDSGRKTKDEDFPGFPDKETALVYLTHPMSGHFYLNKDSRPLGCWEIYHVPMEPNLGEFDEKKSNFVGMFENMGLISKNQKPYNVLIQSQIDYDIYLPPIESISDGSRYNYITSKNS